MVTAKAKVQESGERSFVAMLNSKNEVLCVKRALVTNNGGTWGLPGGHRNKGEHAEKGAEREVLEEIGHMIFLDRNSYLKLAIGKRTLYVMRGPDSSRLKTLKLDPNEVSEAKYIGLGTLLSMPDVELHKSITVMLTAFANINVKDLYVALRKQP